MFDALGGALCVWAVLATLAALGASGALPAGRRRVLWEIATMGAVLVVVYAMAGRAGAVTSMLIALVIAGGVGGAARAGRGVPPTLFLRGSFGPLAALALAWPLVASGADAWNSSTSSSAAMAASLAGAAAAWAAVWASAWAASFLLRAARTPVRFGGAWHFAGAGACALVAYVAGVTPGPVAVVVAGGMIALIGAQLAAAMGGDAWRALTSALDGFAACSVVAAGVCAGNGAMIVVGVVLAVGCAAVHAGALTAQRRCI